MVLSVGPKVDITSLLEKRVESGANVGLTCVLTQGDPPVVFHWLKEGRPVETVPGVTVTYEKLASLMLISTANETHTGSYTCVASNPVGASLAMTDILVNGNRKAVDV